MLRMIGELEEFPIFSIRTGDVIGKLVEPIIKPGGLKVIAFYVESLRSSQELILGSEDIREVTPGGVIVDDSDKLMELDDLVRIQEVIDINFIIIGKRVLTESGGKVGKVQNYAVDDLNWEVAKLYSGRNILRDLSSTGKVIDRKQIVEVTDKKIVVRDATIKSQEGVWAASSVS